jgi:hypothetical protein
MQKNINNQMVSVFRELDKLFKTGRFTELEIDFMEKYLDCVLSATRKLKNKIKEEKIK